MWMVLSKIIWTRKIEQQLLGGAVYSKPAWKWKVLVINDDTSKTEVWGALESVVKPRPIFLLQQIYYETGTLRICIIWTQEFVLDTSDKGKMLMLPVKCQISIIHINIK